MSTPSPSMPLVNPHISESSVVNRTKRLTNLASVAIPPLLGFSLLVFTPVTLQPSLFSILLAMSFFILGSMGLGIGFHRHFTHHAFKTTSAGKAVLSVLGSWSLQGPIISWVADHRRHHRFADQQYDPHSPWADDMGLINNRLAGWFHAHIGWKFSAAESDEKRYVPDLLKDPVVMFVSRNYWPLAISGLLLPGVIGFMHGGWSESLTCLLWAGCVRAILLNQFEGVANSITHLFGSQVDAAKDKSRDNLWLSVVLMGEGLHSYHHQNATVAVNEPSKFDAFGQFIMLCAYLGLVWDLRKAKPSALAETLQPQTGGLKVTATI